MKYSSIFYLFPIWINAKMNVYTLFDVVGRPFSFFSLGETQQIASLHSFSCWSMSLVGHSLRREKQVLNIMSMRSGARAREHLRVTTFVLSAHEKKGNRHTI